MSPYAKRWAASFPIVTLIVILCEMRGKSDALHWLCAHAVLWLIIFVALGARRCTILRIANRPINLPEHSAMGLAGLAALALALHIGLLMARRLDGHVLMRLAAAAAVGAGIFVLLFWTLVTALGITGFVD